MTKTFKKQIEEMALQANTEYDNNVLIWAALEKLADAIDKQIQYS